LRGCVGALEIPALERWRQDDHEFKSSLDYIKRSYFKKDKEGRRGRGGRQTGGRKGVGGL
jgi:hypothetical protein